MHLGIDISQTGAGKAGCGYFAHAMIRALLHQAPEHRYTLYPSFGDFYLDERMPGSNPYAGADVHYGPRFASRTKARAFWTDAALEQSLGMPDLVHANNFWCPRQLHSARLVYTLYDLGFVVEPRWTTETNRVGCFEGVFRSSIAADWIVAISEASRRHYLSIFPHFPEDRIRVVYPCSRFGNTVAAGIRPKALSDLTPDGFWLSVGTIEPRKNQRRLAEAYARYLAAGGRPMPLVLAGGNGWLMDDFVRTLEQLGISQHVRMTGYVNDDELIWLYRNCYANLYPSLFEGFGLPLLEGMQFGAASVASNSSSLPEVAADAAILLDPGDTRAWTQCLLHLAANPTARDHWRAAAPAQAARFSERTIAHALLQLYEEAVAKPKRTSPPAGASTPRGRL